MPSGFKGTRVEFESVSILSRSTTGAVVQARVQFVDNDGLVHARTTHELALTANPQIAAAARNLLDELRRWTEAAHFDHVENPIDNVVLDEEESGPKGIAEALRGTDEPGGTQG